MKRTTLPEALTGAIIFLAIALPLLSVVPLGWLWLWQNDYFFVWLAGTLVLSLVLFAGRSWFISRLKKRKPVSAGVEGATDTSGPQGLTARETAAWDAISKRIDEIDPDKLTSQDDLIQLGLNTVEDVAAAMHPGEKEPVWKFTVPEALALVEQVAARLGPLVSNNIPMGDRLTVGQVIRIYRWRFLIDVGEKLYDVWRIVRLVNPVAAVTNEVREKMSRAAIQNLTQDVAKRLAGTYVREVGRAAIDLYSGRLKVRDEVLREHTTAQTRSENAGAAGQMAEPLRFLVFGQVSAGKSSLINALAGTFETAVDALPATGEFKTVSIEREGMPELVLIDSPGLTNESDRAALLSKALDCDLIVLTVSANRADRDADRRMIAELRTVFDQMIDRRPPPVVVVASHIDQLRPFNEWSPPYDLTDIDQPKVRSINAALEAITEDLQVSLEQIVPVSLPAQGEGYNIEAVWAELADRLPDAKSARLLRCLRDAAGKQDWRRIGSQVIGAGRLAYSTWKSRDKKR